MFQENVLVQDRPTSDCSFIAPLTYLWYGGDANTAEMLRVLVHHGVNPLAVLCHEM